MSWNMCNYYLILCAMHKKKIDKLCKDCSNTLLVALHLHGLCCCLYNGCMQALYFADLNFWLYSYSVCSCVRDTT